MHMNDYQYLWFYDCVMAGVLILKVHIHSYTIALKMNV